MAVYWPSYIVGAFFMAVILFDIITNEWRDLPYHAVVGLVLTGFYALLCLLLSDTVAGAALLIPAAALIGFMIALWMTGENMKRRGCCLHCREDDENAASTTAAAAAKSGSAVAQSTVAEIQAAGAAAVALTGLTALPGTASTVTAGPTCQQRLNATPIS
jgi:hypothetical protein